MNHISEKDKKILQYYQTCGIEDITTNNLRSYLKQDKCTRQLSDNITDKIMTKAKNEVKCEPNPKSSTQIAAECSSLDELEAAIKSFKGCALKDTTMTTVFADGARNAKVMLIGEAPGAMEEQQGIPFCGESGQLLDKILATVGLDRKTNLYITNTVFWRPPGNRKPTQEELEICLPFVEKHIAILNPKLLILAGSVALYSLFKITNPISQCRQKILMHKNNYLAKEIPTIVIFHPSYLLRQPAQKKLAWQDMLFIKKFLDGEN